MNNYAEMSKAELVRELEGLHPVVADRDELTALVRDLQCHQLELEMQNRALREAQQALEESHHRYVDLYDFAPVAYVSLDARTCIQELNLTAAGMLKHERPRLLGQPFLPFVEPADAGRFLQHVRQCAAGEGTGSLELKLRIGGARVDIRLHSAAAHGGQSRGAVCRMALLDITELRQTQLRLGQAERLASLGTLAAGVAHELNNPLAFISQSLELARLKLEESGAGAAVHEAQAMLVDAAVGTEQLRTIVHDLHAFARVGDERQEPVDVREVLNLSARMAQAELRHRARLVRDFAEVPPVLANEGRLGQVFLNLLVNAAHAIPEGAADRNEIRVVTRSVAGAVVVEVHDTGRGIPPERLGQIFDPFFTTRPEGRGLGLGLSISHSLVTRMGGEISVESEPGRGSVFRVRLPVAPPRPEVSGGTVQGPRSKPRPKPTRRGRILIVDDEVKLGLTLGMLLEDAHEVTRCQQARVALELIQGGPPYDAVICDLMMPEMTGAQLYERVAASHPEQARRIIFMTGGAFTEEASGFLERVSNPRLTKPFKVEELERLLAAVFG